MLRTSIVLVASLLLTPGLIGCNDEIDSVDHHFELTLEDGIPAQTAEALLVHLPTHSLACAKQVLVQYSPRADGEDGGGDYLVTIFWLTEEYLQSEVWNLSLEVRAA